MGVYIKEFDVPKDCAECDDDGLRWIVGCRFFSFGIGRSPFCPLTEVKKPHGRLIDADFEEKHYASMTINPTPDVTPQDHMHSGYAAKAFQMAKTVIEAER